MQETGTQFFGYGEENVDMSVGTHYLWQMAYNRFNNFSIASSFI